LCESFVEALFRLAIARCAEGPAAYAWKMLLETFDSAKADAH